MKKLSVAFFCFFLIIIKSFAQIEPKDTDYNGYRNVKTLDHLLWITKTPEAWSMNFELDNDIDASATRNWNIGDHDNNPATPDSAMGWDPIGENQRDFHGNFNGNNHSIKNLYIYRPKVDYVGFFRCVFAQNDTSSSTIQNLHIKSCNITGKDYVGAFASRMEYSTIMYNCSSSGTVKGAKAVGGISGLGIPVIHNCLSECDVTGVYCVGGFAGICGGQIQNCAATGNVTGKYLVGGFSGFNSGYIRFSFCKANVVGDTAVGGFSGKNEGIIRKTYSSGQIEGNRSVGGFIGLNIDDYNYIQNCYSLANVKGNENVGGFIGRNITNHPQKINVIKYCHSYGSVLGEKFAGCFNGKTNFKMTSCFYFDSLNVLSDTSGAIELTKQQFVEKTIFENAGWEFDTIWTMGASYPTLQKYKVPLKDTDKDGFFEIWTLEDLRWLSENRLNLGQNLELMNDIDAEETKNWYNGAGFQPIYNFAGNFNGNYHSIKNIYINSNGYCGLFVKLESYNTVFKNFKLENCKIVGKDYVGAIVGIAKNITLENIMVSGSIKGNTYVGGIVGTLGKSRIKNCISKCSVSGDLYVGGLVSQAYSSKIQNSIICVEDTLFANNHLGGLAYRCNDSDINNCFIKCNVKSSNQSSTKLSGAVPYAKNSNFINIYSVCNIEKIYDFSGFGASFKNCIVQSCFWDIDKSSITKSSIGIGLPSTEMKIKETFTSKGWDFDIFWDIDSCINEGYPYLRWAYDLMDNECEPSIETNVKILLFPNPAKDILSVVINKDLIDAVEIFDVLGNRIKYFDNITSISFEFYLSNIARGCYYIKVYYNKTNQTKMFIKI